MWRASALALLLAAAALLSSPAHAQSTNIPNSANAVNGNHIRESFAGFTVVGSDQIADNAVGSAQIATNSVGSSHIPDNAVDTAQIGNNSIDLLIGTYTGRLPGGTTDSYVGVANNSLAPDAIINSGCVELSNRTFQGDTVLQFRCNSALDLPIRGDGVFNANRVLVANAIGSADLSERAIGYTQYLQRIFLGALGVTVSQGDSHIVNNSLNSRVLADGSIGSDQLTDVANGILANTMANSLNIGINSDQFAANGVETAAIADEAVTIDKLADGAIAAAGLADDVVDIAKLADEAVSAAKLASGAVTTAKIVDDAVITAKLADGSVTSDKFADEAVTTAKLVDGSVVKAKFAESSVTTAKLVDDAVTTAKLADASVTTDKLAAGAVTTAKIVDDAVTTAKLADGAVTAAKIVDDAVTTVKIVDKSVTAAKFADGAVTAAKIVDSAVTTAKLAAGAVTSAKLADGAVTSAKIVDDAVTSAKIADQTITGSRITREAITFAEIEDGTVGSEAILDASVGEVELDIKLVSDFDVIGRTGQHSVADAVAIATAFADTATLTSSTGKVLANLSSVDKFNVKQVIADFTTSGVVATGSAAYAELSSGVAKHIASLLGGAALAQQEIGKRDDTVGSDWTSSSLRGQTRWVRDRGMELGERIDFTHQNIDRIGAEIDVLDRGIAMAAAVGNSFVREDKRASLDVAVATFGEKQGVSVGFGLRLTKWTQFNVAAAATEDFDENIMRFGAHTQF